MVVITIIIWVFLFGTEATEKMELEDWKTEKKCYILNSIEHVNKYG